MHLQILGCSGGIGGANRSTSFLLNDSILIDAGTGVGDLSFTALTRIEHVFLTHAHLDHIACLPMLADTILGSRSAPLTVYASKATLDALKKHIFNWAIWPDFNKIPNSEAPFLRYATLETGQSCCIEKCTITAIPAVHTVPAVGYQLDSGQNSIIFSGDSVCSPAFWDIVNTTGNLGHLIIETAFSNREYQLANTAKHFCPLTLLEQLKNLSRPCQIWVTHLKPADSELTMQEILQDNKDLNIRRLEQNQVINF
ncbi:MBL fold metallo-hydrolase [Iodobacter ciconiae]|uniref:3',5'-cyclic-nucleotide phosphodiesterase n=1 Tax=Iodobacter ciconiae TaxID=2496266 RepID=A0A3S8ZTN0_9NEIS|nr:3',5'-cyclic-nucleotide phosphodiesterase [Iodobacter ciconiae]AZN36819.1 3',5'-cyclic-nucleotide phosphodiesterase [Iodobacter ciconiae]